MEGNLLFVGGDLSGIQKFIYNITSKRAMVSLKGRSYYLKTLTDKICEDILNVDEVKNSSMNKDEMKIYCSGGKFYLQVPDTGNIRNAIYSIRGQWEKQLWEEHHGQLSVNIDFVPFVYVGDQVKLDNETGKIGILWKKMTEKFNALKNQKFKNILLNGDLFDVQKVGGDVKVCQVSGIEGAKEYTFTFKDDDKVKEESLLVLDSVKNQIDLGCKLRDEQKFKMLEDYAGDTYLGVLRMDVDNLGSKFIKSDFKNMNEYKVFSKKLDEFFDGEKGVLHKLQTRPEYSDFLNIVYAGGDDIFVVGRWDKVIDFAAQVREEFAKYCQNVLNDTTLSISGGVAIVHSKFPIAKSAEMAGEAEDAAKKHNDGRKNAFNLFGESVSWDDKEFGYVKKYKEQFVSFINDYGLSRSILHKIMTYAAIVKDNQLIQNDNKKYNLKRKINKSYIWHTVYYLTRYMDKEKGNKVVYNFCKDLRDAQLHTDEHFRLMSMAARWAELELRINTI